MRTHFHNEMKHLKERILDLASKVEDNVNQAIKAVDATDAALAAKVREADRLIDDLEVRNEEECLKIIALHQPVADDLRYLVVMLKVNHELERIGDLAADIAKHVASMDELSVGPFAGDLAELEGKTREMVSDSIDALLEQDGEKARKVWMADDDVDDRTDGLVAKVQDAFAANPTHPATLFGILAAAGHLERMADHATNIAKDVIYLATGETVRHRRQEFTESA